MADGTQTALVPYEIFRSELVQRQDEIATLLPSTIKHETFINTAIIAVKQNAELLDCDRRSLHKAVTASARDGLMPDGKEGVIIPQKENGVKAARWQPMTYGIRKRARELDEIVIDAQVVYEHDTFVWRQGDDPHIEHAPAQLGQPRGRMVGAYAIFKRGDDILHREVMDADQIAAVKAISKQPNGLMWKDFTQEAWRKTVVRRGSKTLPCSEKLRTIIERDDDLYDVGDRPALVVPKGPPPAPAKKIVPPSPPTQAEVELFAAPDRYLAHLEEEMIVAGDAQTLGEVWAAHLEHSDARLSRANQEAAKELYAKFARKFEGETMQLPM